MMGWANCGSDDLGRPIGYAHEATCDHPGCNAKIDRGLSYVCGGMHGGTEYGCGRYFCEVHRSTYFSDKHHYHEGSLCEACGKAFETGEDWKPLTDFDKDGAK